MASDAVLNILNEISNMQYAVCNIKYVINNTQYKEEEKIWEHANCQILKTALHIC